MAGPAELSKRELEVARLVAAGLTNRQIADRLFIAERTAEGHVERIRNKLGFSSRSQVAAWFAASAATPTAGGASGPQPAISSPGGIAVFLLTDLEGSTRWWDLKPAEMRQAMAKHDEIVAACIERHGGGQVEAGREGDSVLATFPNVPAAAEAAIEIQHGIRTATWPDGLELHIRVAIHAGEAQLRGGHYYGHALNRCARLIASCHPGQTVVSKAAQELLADELPQDSTLWDLGLHVLKDLKRPEQVFQLVDLRNPVEFPPLRSLSYKRTNLPAQSTTFVGRRDDLRQLQKLEAETKLITLVGPGGCGKTRLAQEVAGETAPDRYPDGVWFADLTPIVAGDLVALAIASSMELQEQVGRAPLQTILEYCEQRRLLLILDNCEQVIDACARFVHELISSCPYVQVIATSREPLKVPGETIWRVNPLSLPEATRLFLDRAHSHAPTLELTESRLPIVTRICERLDGIPLAMELAAARVPMMSVEEILERLEKGLALLAGGSRTAATRQQTLTATMDWSYDLLDQSEQILFRRLAVFPGTFSMSAGEGVCGDSALQPNRIADVLLQLVSKSLVVASEGRYGQLATIRAYAAEKLQAASELDLLARQHAHFYLGLAASRRPGESARWLRKVEDDQHNLASALRWASRSEPELGARLAHELFSFWLLRGHIIEARQSLDELLGTLPEDAQARPTMLVEAGAFAYVGGQFDIARSRLDEGIERSAKAGDKVAVIRGLYLRGVLETARNELGAAQQSLEGALRMSLEIQNSVYEAEVLHQLGMVSFIRGDSDEASSLLQRSVDLRRQTSRSDEAGMSLVFLAVVSTTRGDVLGARASIREALEVGLALQDRRSAWSLDALACIEATEGRNRRALRLAGAASAMFDSTGQRPPEGWHLFTSTYLGPSREHLGPELSQAEWDEGRGLEFEEALAYALREDAETESSSPNVAKDPVLSRPGRGRPRPRKDSRLD